MARTADGKVQIALAHPITQPHHKRALGLDVDKKYRQGDVVEVTVPAATSLIAAGAAQVDPENREQVKAALSGESPEKVAQIGAGVEPSGGKSGETKADAKK